jgi:hypothetical protein
MSDSKDVRRHILHISTGLCLVLSVALTGACNGSKQASKEQRARADGSRKSVQLKFQNYRSNLPSTVWSDDAVAGYLPCGKGRVNYLIQSLIEFYNEKGSAEDYLSNVRLSLQSSGWVAEVGGSSLDFRLKNGQEEFHFTGFKGVAHARTWLYGSCMKVDPKIANELQSRSKDHCMSTVRPKGVTSPPDIGSLCSWGRLS